MTQSEKAPLTRGVHHVGLTVPLLEPTLRFFLDVLGFSVVGERPEYPAVFVSDGTVMLTLWQAAEPDAARSFDRKHNVGLHHLALMVRDAEALAQLHERLAKTDAVQIEFAPEPLGTTALRHMMCAIPGGIRVEFIVSTAQDER